jgi:hypothetical protein
VKAGAIQVRFGGLDEPVVTDGPKFLKSVTVDHARDGEVMIAYGMNGEQLPMLNGFPLRLVVPGWSGVYWVKMLNNIEVLSKPDTNYWTSTAYRVPDVPNHTVEPGDKGFRLVPATGNVPRSFITNVHDGDKLKVGAKTLARGVAFGGDCGVAGVDASIDEGKSWATHPAWSGPRQVQSSGMADAVNAACNWRADADGSVHQHRRFGAAEFPGLESIRLSLRHG